MMDSSASFDVTPGASFDVTPKRLEISGAVGSPSQKINGLYVLQEDRYGDRPCWSGAHGGGMWLLSFPGDDHWSVASTSSKEKGQSEGFARSEVGSEFPTSAMNWLQWSGKDWSESRLSVRHLASGAKADTATYLSMDVENAEVESSLGQSGELTESLLPKKTDRRTKCAICCAVCLLISVTGGLLGVFMGPSIAKNALDASEITFTKLTMSDPKDFTFTTQAHLTISKVAPLGCSIGAMELQVMYDNVEVGKLQMPQMDVQAYKDNHKSVEASTFRVTNVSTWNAFSSAMLRKETVTWRLKSKVDITALGVTFRQIDFDKQIPLSCFKGLDDMQMDVFDMSRSTPSDLLVDMTVCMRNPSDIAIMSLGDLFFGIYYMGEYMGNVTAQGAAISVTRQDDSNGDCGRFGKHGYNSLQMSGTLSPANHSVSDVLMSRYLSNHSSMVNAKALSPANTLPLFNEGMQGLSLATALNGNDKPLIVGLDMLNAMMIPVDDASVTMTMLARVHVASPLGAQSSLQISQVAMSINMIYAGSVVGTITTPLSEVPPPNAVVGRGSFSVPCTSASMSLANRGAALAALAKDLINKDTLTMSLDGQSNCTAMSEALGFSMTIVGVPVNLPNLHAIPATGPVVVSGMGGLPDVEILDYVIPGIVPDGTDGCKEFCGVRLDTTVNLPNPSPFGLKIGTLNAQVRTMDGVTLGNVSASGLTLNPGSNVISMSGKLFASSDTLPAMAVFFSNYLKNLTQKTQVAGIDAGNSTSKWLHETIGSMSLNVEFPGAGNFDMLTDIEVQTMKMTFQEGDHPPTLSGSIRAKMHMPKPVSMSIIKDAKSSSMKFEMIEAASGKSFASLTVQSDVQYDSKNGAITASFAESDLNVVDKKSFQNIVKTLLLSEKTQIRMRGFMSPTVVINIGEMQLQDLPFEGETTLFGFNSFLGSKGESLMTIQGELDLLGGKNGVVDMRANADCANPSNVAVSLGRIALELWSDDNHKISDMTIDNFALAAGPNRTTSFVGIKATYNVDAAGLAGRKFLSSYAVGENQMVSIRGPKKGWGTSISLLKPALKAFKTKTIVPGLPYPKNRLLVSGVMNPPNGWEAFTKFGQIPTVLKVQNPFGIPFTFKTSFCDVTACNDYDAEGRLCKAYSPDALGYYTPDEIGVVVKGRESKTIPRHNTKMYKVFSPAAIQTLFASLNKGALIKLKGNMTLGVGENTEVTVDYSEIDVPVHTKFNREDDAIAM